jgi:hypothetical protein
VLQVPGTAIHKIGVTLDLEQRMETTSKVPRIATVPLLVLGDHVLLGAIVLEEMDLVVDCARACLVPNVGTWEQPVFRV